MTLSRINEVKFVDEGRIYRYGKKIIEIFFDEVKLDNQKVYPYLGGTQTTKNKIRSESR